MTVFTFLLLMYLVAGLLFAVGSFWDPEDGGHALRTGKQAYGAIGLFVAIVLMWPVAFMGGKR